MFPFGKFRGDYWEIGSGMNGKGIRDFDLRLGTVLPLPSFASGILVRAIGSNSSPDDARSGDWRSTK
jgi:hypothetical protein